MQQKKKRQTLHRTSLHYTSQTRLLVSDLSSLLSAIDTVKLSKERDEKKNHVRMSIGRSRFEQLVCSCLYMHISYRARWRKINKKVRSTIKRGRDCSRYEEHCGTREHPHHVPVYSPLFLLGQVVGLRVHRDMPLGASREERRRSPNVYEVRKGGVTRAYTCEKIRTFINRVTH